MSLARSIYYKDDPHPLQNINLYKKNILQSITIMPNKYTKAHRTENLGGPTDARPTALQIVKDEHLINNMPDKVFLITGVSAGIGTETALALAATGAKVFGTARDLPKAQEACKSFLSPGRVELIEMDNTSLASVRSAAQTFLSKSKTLNVLVNNAGIMNTPYSKTSDGHESQFGTNHLAHFLLFNLLRPALLASSTPTFNSRVIDVSSSGHGAGEVQFNNYTFSNGARYDPWAGYGQSKTANIYMANEIENRYGKQGLHGLSLMPGGIWTNLQRHVPEEMMKEWKARPNVEDFMKSTEQGAATTVLAAVGKEYEGKGRLYLENCDTAELAEEGDLWGGGYMAHAFNKEKEGRLWRDSLEMVGLEGS